MTLINVIPLKELTIYDLSLAFLLSAMLTAGSLGLVLLPRLSGLSLPRRRNRDRGALEARFVFDGEDLSEAPTGWHELLEGQGDDTDWQRFRAVFSARFHGVPRQVSGITGPPLSLAAASASDPALLRLKRRRDQLTVTLTETRPAGLTDRYAALHARQQQDLLEDRLEHLPIPVWTMGDGGVVTSGNAAFRNIGDRFAASDEAVAPLLRSADRAEGRPGFTYRAQLPAMDRQAETWVDVSARRSGGLWDCAALDVSDLVKAELAQRNFVQTLTKTFAQLSTGLAIFDRDRQLILFNPALLDLTQLSPEFLASRPALSHFFDHLRDRQIMPEPKDYTSWREQLNALVSAAADGRYQDTWSLASGATYRVTGRPHPNGAVAFLFEDITDHIAMTRRFRHQLSLSQSVLDAFSDAIALFDGDGVLSHCNQAYREMFHAEIPEHEAADLQELTAREAHEIWSRQALSPRGLDDVLARLVTRSGREATRHVLQLRQVGEVTCSVLPLVGGARMVSFGCQRAALPATLEAEPQSQKRVVANSA